MRASIVIRSHQEAPRLRLTLASLEGQDGLDEVVVVDDGSTDETGAALMEAATRMPLRIVRHPVARGRSAASNAGAEAARGDLSIFLDGDTLAGRDLVRRHRDAHAGKAGLIGRGETWHLRCTRFLSDPARGTFWLHERAREARVTDAERETMRVTAQQVRDDFPAIERRAIPGIYPGADPLRLYDAEVAAIRTHSASARLWAAASGSNLSVSRTLFRAAGGFDEAIDINEHRVLAYRLYERGARLVLVEGARSYHLTHRNGWRDPLQDDRWERRFRAAHPEAPVGELMAYWRALSAAAAPDAPELGFFAA